MRTHSDFPTISSFGEAIRGIMCVKIPASIIGSLMSSGNS